MLKRQAQSRRLLLERLGELYYTNPGGMARRQGGRAPPSDASIRRAVQHKSDPGQ